MTNLEPIPVLVTGIGGGGHGEQIVKALRLGEQSYFIVGTDIGEHCSTRTMVDEFRVVPWASEKNYIDSIVELIRRYRIRVVFHGTEQEMLVISEARDRLSAEGVYLPVNSSGILKICSDKIETMKFLSERGHRVPASTEIHSLDDVDLVEMFPAVLKPAVGGGGSANVFIVQTREELRAFASHLLGLYPRWVVQEYVGTPEQEYTVGVLFGADGTLINSIAVRRIISIALTVRCRIPNESGRTELGPSLVISSGVSQGVVGRWKSITGPCEEIASALGATAPINIQCRYVDGQVVPFEINPRFSGTTSVRAMAGYNEPDVLIRRDVLGEEISVHFPYDECVILRGLAETKFPAAVDEFDGQRCDQLTESPS